jgi:hypothetical protein
MADDHTQRAYRSNEYAREPMKTAQGGNDPLAELARLIGQADPFAEFGRKPQATQQPAQHSEQDWAPQPYATQDYGQPASPHAGYEPAGYAEPASQYDSDPYYQDGAYQNDQPYDDVPPPVSRRRVSILAIAAVIALAVVGTAGAVGYRALFGSSGSSPPPVIKADTTPSKVVPPTKSEQSNKLIYDRVGERSSGEKIVSREEQPLDINKAPQAVAFPNTLPPTQQPMTAGSGSVAAADQPKKIHTIAIRPDQPMGAPEPASQPAPAATPQAPPPPLPPRAAAPQRLASAPQVATADADAPVARAAPVHQAPPRNAPLSLSPNAAPPAPAAPVRTASAPPARNPAPAANNSGHYAVQISSQRSEAEAQAAFRALQAKYPAQLGNRQPLIRRADLGSKGVYYRALVGPFADGSDAVALCQSLKAAGGSCLIQKN